LESSEFFLGLDEFMEQAKAKALLSFEHKILRSLLVTLFSAERYQAVKREAGREFGLQWFNDNTSCPVALYATKVAVTPKQLVKSAGMTKTKLWDAYFNVKREHDVDAPVALAFRLPGVSTYVIHNHVMLERPSGQNVIIRKAVDVNKALVILPWQAFLHGLGAVWGECGVNE
jgi:hypothetical protein